MRDGLRSRQILHDLSDSNDQDLGIGATKIFRIGREHSSDPIACSYRYAQCQAQRTGTDVTLAMATQGFEIISCGSLIGGPLRTSHSAAYRCGRRWGSSEMGSQP
jgi:hypothetical protein